jgi:hypothetical protein
MVFQFFQDHGLPSTQVQVPDTGPADSCMHSIEPRDFRHVSTQNGW